MTLSFEKILTIILTPFMVPIVIVMYVVNLLSKDKTFGGFFEEAENFANAEEEMKRIQAEVVQSTPSLDHHMQISSQAQVLIQAEDWGGLSHWIKSLDQSRASCEANICSAETALTAVLQHFATDIFDGHTCHPDPIYLITDETAETFEQQAQAHPDSYPLRVIAAQMRCYQGWTHRGADYGVYVSDDGWFGMGQHFKQAEILLDAFDPIELDAPLLAATRHKLLAFMPNAKSHVRPFYEDWSKLNPMDQAPHEKHAMMMLPRWFGSDHDLQIAASQAAANTHVQTGEAAYFTMYRRVLDDWDPNVLSLDPVRLAKGAHDFLALRNNDPAVVGELIENMRWWSAFGSARGLDKVQKQRRDELSLGFKKLAKDLLRSRLTAIYPKSWEDGVEGCRLEILEACRTELDQGKDIILNGAGVVFR